MKKKRNQVQGKNTCKFSLLRRSILLFILMCFLSACFTTKKTIPPSKYSFFASDSLPVLHQNHFGYSFKDLRTGRVLTEQHSTKRFIPASNTKILSLYTALNRLADTLPAYRYTRDSLNQLLIRPLAYPALLHPDFEAWQSPFSFLADARTHIYIDSSTWHCTPYGQGWMWDDFPYGYSAERSALPIFGNAYFLEKKAAQWMGIPYDFSTKKYTTKVRRPRRLPFSADVLLPHESHSSPKKSSIPIYQAASVVPYFLADTLQQVVQYADLSAFFSKKTNFLMGCPRDTVLRAMMHHSDNFLAEQLLLMCAAQRQQDTLSEVDWLSDTLFVDLPKPMRWVDASGLSRYNALSPEAIQFVLEKMWHQNGNIIDFFPAAGMEGTLQHDFKSKNTVPYMFAKSGSMSGVYCLSGYLRSASGRWISFSVMVNGFVGSSKPIKAEIQTILENIRTTY